MTQQSRITLRNLKVAQFASEETLCFRATVLFDGKPIAEASNQGHGGNTDIRALNGQQAKVQEAEKFAKALPPVISEFDEPHKPGQKMVLPMHLEFLIDELAAEMDADKRLRARFRSDYARKVMFVIGDDCRYVKKLDLRTLTNRESYFAQIKQAHPTAQILAELPEEQAFALWKRTVVKGNGAA